MGNPENKFSSDEAIRPYQEKPGFLHVNIEGADDTAHVQLVYNAIICCNVKPGHKIVPFQYSNKCL